jgi:hypothetical protein
MRAFKHHGHQFSRTRLDWRDAIPVCAHSHFGKDVIQAARRQFMDRAPQSLLPPSGHLQQIGFLIAMLDDVD